MKIINILTPYWFKIIWDDTASKMHLTQVTSVTCTSDWQQNLTHYTCMICDMFNTKVNTSVTLCSTHIYWLKGKKGLPSYCFWIQVHNLSAYDRSGWHQHAWNLNSAHFYWLQTLASHACVICHYILIFWEIFHLWNKERCEKSTTSLMCNVTCFFQYTLGCH